ncbi:MAG: choice-of-anchor Q domain-containing protein [Rhodoglobus sp.]
MARPRTGPRLAAAAAVCALALAGVVLTSTPAHAATYSVTSSADSGAGSLREAIGLANGSIGPDEITFQAGLGDITLTSGTIEINDPLTISGPGPSALSIVRDGSFDMFLVDMDVTGDVVIGGLDFIGNSLLDSGRAIVVPAGDPGLENLTVGNTWFGGFSSASEGGAVTVYAANNTVSISNSVFTLNDSDFPGGAVYVGNTGGSLLVTDSEFTGNQATEGGALFVDAVAALIVQGSSFTENTAEIDGGAIALATASGASGIRYSTFTDNTAGDATATDGLGGAIYIASIPVDTQFDISQTAVLGSTVVEGSVQSFGAGLFVDQTDGVLLIDSTTFHGGQFVPGAGSAAGSGLSIALCDVASTGTVRVINSTFDETSALENFAIHACVNDGNIELLYSTFVAPGALYINNNGGSADIYSTILNATTNPYAVATGDGAPVHTAWNLFSTATIPAFTTSGGGDRYLVTDPGLGPLALNGGPTPTRLPLVGGAAYDSGDPGVALLTPPTWDQRGSGFPRVDGRIDIGAVEIPRSLPSTGQPVSGAAGLASILLVIAGIGLVAQARRALLRDLIRQST